MVDVVERQVDAYNFQDLDGFVACYAKSVVIEDAEGDVLINGREAVREHYGNLFERFPNRRATIESRTRVGSYVVDEERIVESGRDEIHVVVIYRLDADGLIDRVRLVR